MLIERARRLPGIAGATRIVGRMIIGVDARTLVTHRGAWRYVNFFVRAIAAAYPDDELRMLVAGSKPLVEPPAGDNVRIVRPDADSRRYYARSALLRRPRLDRELGVDLDVFWAPATAPLSISRDVPMVLTVYDLSFEQRPQDFTRYDRVYHLLTRPRGQGRRAQRILVTTCTVRDEVVAAWGIDPAKIDVVAPGIVRPAWSRAEGGGLPRPDRALVAAVRTRHALPERYFLAVGDLEPRKAPDLLARAHARASTDTVLAFVGEGRLADVVRGPNVRLLGKLPDEELDLLYAGALALCYPSYLEGFGFPPLEAAVRGTPSVVSDLPVLRETLDGAASFILPGDEEALTAALARMAGDDALRRRLAIAAFERAAPHTWEAAAHGARATLARAAGLA